MTVNYNVTGSERKRLVGAISQELNAPAKYLGVPSVAYEVGGYRIDKAGTVTGPDNRELTADLYGVHGLTPVSEEYDVVVTEATETPPVFEDLPLTEREELGFGCERRDPPGENAESLCGSPQPSNVPEPDQLVIEIPLDGFTPESLDNLHKLVLSKEPLLKKAFGVEELPIQALEDKVCFPWFASGTDGEKISAYAQFIACLAETAKTKKRVTARAKESFENEKFAMRVWLIGLGMVGKEYTFARKLLMANLGGNSSWRYGAPDKAAPAGETTSAPVDDLAEALAENSEEVSDNDISE